MVIIQCLMLQALAAGRVNIHSTCLLAVLFFALFSVSVCYAALHESLAMFM